MKTIVRVPYCRARSASAITCLISLIPASTAENSMNSALVRCAMIFASVVLPVPGGPQKMSEPVSSRSTWVRSGLPEPIRCSCPTYSSSVRGRMRSASGRVASAALPAFGMGWNRFTTSTERDGLRRFHKLQLRRGRQRADLRRVLVEQPQAFQTASVELVVNILGQIASHIGLTHLQPRRPFAHDLIEIRGFHPMIARLLKHP